jgi:hypothetical protein
MANSQRLAKSEEERTEVVQNELILGFVERGLTARAIVYFWAWPAVRRVQDQDVCTYCHDFLFRPDRQVFV